MMSIGTIVQIKEHMEVVCVNGDKVGTVDHVEGDRIKLTRHDSPDGRHHYISTSLVAKVDDKVHLNETAPDVMRTWETE
jgi:hypothetical protein